MVDLVLQSIRANCQLKQVGVMCLSPNHDTVVGTSDKLDSFLTDSTPSQDYQTRKLEVAYLTPIELLAHFQLDVTCVTSLFDFTLSMGLAMCVELY